MHVVFTITRGSCNCSFAVCSRRLEAAGRRSAALWPAPAPEPRSASPLGSGDGRNPRSAAQRTAAARPQCRILSRHNLEGANSALLCSARLRHRAPLRTKSWGSSVPCLPFAGSPVARISCDVQQPGQLQGRVLGSECPE